MTLVEFLRSIAGNEIFGGLVGGSFVMSALYTLRSIPARIGALFQWRFMTEVVVHSEDESFAIIEDWLEDLEYAKRARRLRLTSKYLRHASGGTRSRVVPGNGWHLAWIDGRPIVISRAQPQEAQAGLQTSRRLENITIRAPGRDATFLRRMLAGLIEKYEKTSDDGVAVYIPRYDSWSLSCMKSKRSVDSVVLPEEQRRRIVSDVQRFVDGRQWYLDRGIPYRRGFLFYGPPGTGKTSFVIALASHFGKPIYALNMGSVSCDAALIAAVAQVPCDAILLIEDVDAAQAKRFSVKDGAPTPNQEPQEGVTLSALLNSVDGVFAQDGRVLIMTTNDPDKIDPALIRPGRADVRELFGEIGPAEALTMCRQFLGDELAARRFMAAIQCPIAPAELQQRLLVRAA
jgi:chaperone BCS1